MRVGQRARRIVLALAMTGSAMAGTSLALADEVAFVTNQEDETVSVVDLGTMTVTKTIEMSGKPAGIAALRTGSRAFVSRPEAKSIGILDTKTERMIGEIEVGGGPLGIAVHPSGSPVYVADWYSHSLLIVDPQAGTVTNRFETGESPSGVAVFDDGDRLVTADRDSNQISVFEAGTGKVLARVKVGERPFGVTISPDQTRIYAVNVGSDDVTVVDAKTYETIASVPVGSHPYAAAEANGRVFVTDQYAATLSVFDAASFAPIETIDIGEYPEGIEASGDGRFVYVANWFDNTLAKVDTDSGGADRHGQPQPHPPKFLWRRTGHAQDHRIEGSRRHGSARFRIAGPRATSGHTHGAERSSRRRIGLDACRWRGGEPRSAGHDGDSRDRRLSDRDGGRLYLWLHGVQRPDARRLGTLLLLLRRRRFADLL